jgi:homocitrate synthase NifV
VNPSILLEDTTLRDGEQTPGVAFPAETKRRILDLLISAGVKSIEIGIPAMGGDELAFVESCVDRQHEAQLVVWHRGVASEVKRSLDMGFRALHIGLPTSQIHLDASIRKDRDWLLSTARALVSTAKDRGAFVSISAEDVGRTEIGFLQEYAGTVAEAGADRLRLSDTIGVLTPDQYATRVRAAVGAADIAVQCHTHNDFGLATANTLAGLQAGATWFHATVNGLGERAGMPDLAQMVVTLKRLYDIDVGVGRNVFAHESGIHANGMLRDTSSFEPYPPEYVGGERRYVIGKHSGRANVRWALQTEGIEPREELLGACLDAVREAAVQARGSVEPSLVRDVYAALAPEDSSTR